jgi:hypothetical protein
LAGTLVQAHENIVLFGIFSPFPSNGKKSLNRLPSPTLARMKRQILCPSPHNFGLSTQRHCPGDITSWLLPRKEASNCPTRTVGIFLPTSKSTENGLF